MHFKTTDYLSHYTPSVKARLVVRLAGLEPARESRQILSLMRLPITPQSHYSYYKLVYSMADYNTDTTHSISCSITVTFRLQPYSNQVWQIR